MNPQKLKRVVIKEELVALTGDFKLAIILQQMIYWSERVKDFDKFIEEENERAKKKEMDLTSGWIYKSGEELSEEVMLGLSGLTIRRYLEELIDKGYLSRRRNPLYKWDKTYQYRVNIIYINKELNKIGYNLDGYPLFKLNVRERTLNNRESKVERAIPEITTKITTDTTTEKQTLRKLNKQQEEEPINKERNKESIEPSLSKKLTKKEQTEKVINSYELTDSVKDTFKEYLKMRKEMKARMSDHAIKLLLTKLTSITDNPKEQKLMLENSIMGNWKSVFPLKDQTKTNTPEKKGRAVNYLE